MQTIPFSRTLIAAALSAGFALPAFAQIDVRFAMFNASLNRDSSGQLLSDLANPAGAGTANATARRILQATNVAEIIQRANPDVLLVNEFDFDFNGVAGSQSTPTPVGYSSNAAVLFQDNFLSKSHGNAVRGMTTPVTDAYRYTPPTNTGIASGLDLDNSGSVGGGNDAHGFGNYAGQYGFTIYSKYEITQVRSFQNFLWKDMPGNLLTSDPTPGANNLSNFYSQAEIDALRLSSKNHVDVTLNIGGQEVHFLTAHPTPPVFDGAEDRNGKRNADEIRFWKDYINGASYMYDDQGGTGGLSEGARFVIAGDYNADLCDGDSYKVACLGPDQPGEGPNAIGQLLLDPLVNTTLTPESSGGTQAATDPNNNGTANSTHLQDPMFDTADFNDASPGNLRADYVLPSANLTMTEAGVFWPTDSNFADGNTSGELFDLVGQFNKPGLYAGLPSSDHKLVYVNVTVPVPEPETYALFLAGIGLLATVARRKA
ncbi:MAG: endonuclease/exonuclease/phosphatase family protein [Betaproteobacteria bacterium]|nr:endonuclease/exonuclease/phosphatase family protein [Betaproteobacteria bacterium]